jgi:hypothetical protein
MGRIRTKYPPIRGAKGSAGDEELVPEPTGTILPMPDDRAVQAWIRRNEAARAEDRRRDLERSMAERLEEAVRLSRIAAELQANLRREPDVRAG